MAGIIVEIEVILSTYYVLVRHENVLQHSFLDKTVSTPAWVKFNLHDAIIYNFFLNSFEYTSNMFKPI